MNIFGFPVDQEHIWIAIGLFGQCMFFMRFFIQWIVSEKKGESVIPRAFWFFSLGGGVILFIYSIYRQDPVFMLGQGTGLLIYSRNLYLIYRKKPMKEAA